VSPSPALIIAEIANAHQGDPEQALRLVEHAVKAGADAVKFQVYTAEELLVRAHPRYEHFRKQAFARDTWPQLISAVKALSCQVWCDVFGLEALEVALAEGIRASGFDVIATKTFMRSMDDRVTLAQTVLDFAASIRERKLREADT
jgi:sialic acid synthase SpsE